METITTFGTLSMDCLYSDTIVAVATPHGIGGIGIIRLSGPLSLKVAKSVISNDYSPSPRIANFVTVNFDKFADRAIAIYFKKPNSFTGEDIVELQCHGGQILLEKIINHCIKNGARHAKPGEFTRRALLNGKITLAGAESLITSIHAESEVELLMSSDFNTGELHDKMISIEKELINISSQIEGALDHPETVAVPNVTKQLKSFIKTMSQFIENARQSNYIYNGIRVAILGEPNVGKSSVFNAILGTDRSIVTNIPGTTTDTVSETIQINGYKVQFIDTAGIRETINPIEKLGIEKTLCVARDCDIALVFDDTAINLVKSKPFIRVTRDCNPESVKQQIIEMTVGKTAPRNVANARQINELGLTSTALDSALVSTSPDITASCIQTALFHLANITGTNTTESVLDEIFSRFCLGK